MMSLRTIARAAPRALARASATPLPRFARSGLVAARPALLRAQPASAFSTSLLRNNSAKNEIDEEVSAKLANEIEFENDVQSNEPLPASIKDFLDNGIWKVEDVPGKEDVILTRTYGNEKITVSFSIADLQNFEPDLSEEDNAFGDELEDFESSSQQQQQQQRNNAELEQEGNEFDEEPTGTVPCRLNVVIEKPGKGALNVEAIAQDGTIVVENLYYYKDARLAHSTDAEAVHQAHDAYPGPPFGSLDEDLQILMERYLEERGVTSALAVFVPDYMDYKEQKEYVSWLKNVKDFVDA
ncbi:hypothetical protein VTJ83DRAFT_3329 [Remersonia thermophila]|uniref:Uncharacterized protein n=1 Tax=Remersonia thermophila TaxID=72144 RepID=A0ABR4DDP8_9PEZI